MEQYYVVRDIKECENVAICESYSKAVWVALQHIGNSKIVSQLDLALASGYNRQTLEDFVEELLDEASFEIEGVDFIED